MPETVTIKKEEYVELKKKAEEFDKIVDKEGLSEKELKEVIEAQREEGISEEEFSKKHSEQEFVDYILNNLPNTPPNYEQIKDINNNLTQIPLPEGEKLEFGPNRCASN